MIAKLTDLEKKSKWHLKLYEDETRKRSMLCGYSKNSPTWNTLVYINYNIPVEDRCTECMELAVNVCPCGHWAKLHNSEGCELRRCYCVVVGFKREIKKSIVKKLSFDFR